MNRGQIPNEDQWAEWTLLYNVLKILCSRTEGDVEVHEEIDPKAIHEDDLPFLESCLMGLGWLANEDKHWLGVLTMLARMNTARKLDYFIHMEKMQKKGLPSAQQLFLAVTKAKLLR